MSLIMLLADNDKGRGDRLRKWVDDMAAREDFTYRLYAASTSAAIGQIPEEVFFGLGIALISLDYPGALEVGRKIYHASPFCHVIYYGSGRPDMIPYLPSRPVRYLDMGGGEDELKSCLQQTLEQLRLDEHFFHYEDKYQLLLHPLSDICYFTSRDRAVFYQTHADEKGPLRRTLDQIEDRLPSGIFLRCHKSYLVRRDLCRALDKAGRELILPGGVRIPVSRALWHSVSRIFDQNAALDDKKCSFPDIDASL